MQTTRRWPLFLIAAPAAVAVWSGWVGLGQLAGFGIVHPLPGIAPGFELNTAITLPVGVEAYAAYALGAWLRPGTFEAAKQFARASAVGALLLGILGQAAYHLLSAAHASRAPWPVTVLVACLPVGVLGFGAALTHLLGGQESVTGPAIAPVIVTDLESLAATAPAITAAWPRPVSVKPARRLPANATRTRSPARPGQRERAADVVAVQPDVSGADLGRKLGLSERTGRRLLAEIRQSASQRAEVV